MKRFIIEKTLENTNVVFVVKESRKVKRYNFWGRLKSVKEKTKLHGKTYVTYWDEYFTITKTEPYIFSTIKKAESYIINYCDINKIDKYKIVRS